jgi:hypothetical protein
MSINYYERQPPEDETSERFRTKQLELASKAPSALSRRAQLVDGTCWAKSWDGGAPIGHTCRQRAQPLLGRGKLTNEFSGIGLNCGS